MPKTIFMKTTQKNGRFARRSTQSKGGLRRKKRFKSNILSKIEDESFFSSLQICFVYFGLFKCFIWFFGSLFCQPEKKSIKYLKTTTYFRRPKLKGCIKIIKPWIIYYMQNNTFIYYIQKLNDILIFKSR